MGQLRGYSWDAIFSGLGSAPKLRQMVVRFPIPFWLAAGEKA